MRIIAFDWPRYQAQREYLKDMKFIFSSELLTTQSELTWFFYHSQIFRKITIFQEIVSVRRKLRPYFDLELRLHRIHFMNPHHFLKTFLR